MMSFLKNTKVMGVVAVAVVVLGWWWWSGTGSGGDSVVAVQSASSSPASEDLLTLLGSLHSITLDPSIFSDPNFTALSDFGVTIPDEPAGRADPFAPVGFTSSTQSPTPAGH